jgi:hypothetical protein
MALQDKVMATPEPPVSDMLITVKSREIQRGMLAELARDGEGATRHFLAAAHLELVLAKDYEQVGEGRLAFRSRLSAASCLWRAGRTTEARELFATLESEVSDHAEEVRRTLDDLQASFAGGR